VSGCVQKKKARDGIARKRRVSPSPRPAPRNVPGEYTVYQHGADDDVLSVPPRHPQPKKSKPPATVSVRTEEAGAAAAAKSSRKKGVEDRRSGRRNDQQPAEAEADNVKKDVKISSSLRKKYAMKAKAAPVATEESELMASLDAAFPDSPVQAEGSRRAQKKKSGVTTSSPSPGRKSETKGSKSELKQSIDDAIPDWLKDTPVPEKALPKKSHAAASRTNMSQDKPRAAKKKKPIAPSESTDVGASKPVKSSSRSELKQSIDDAIPDWLKDTPVPEKALPKKSSAANASPSPNKAKPSPKPKPSPHKSPSPKKNVGVAVDSSHEDNFDYADNDFEAADDEDKHWEAVTTSKPVKSSSRSELKQSIDDAIPDWLKDTPVPEKVSPKKSNAANASPSPNKAKPSPKKHVGIAAEPEEIPVEATVPEEDGLDAYYSNSDDQQASAGASPLRSVVGRAGTPPSQSKASQKSSQEGVEDYGADEDFEPLEDDEEERLMGGAVSATGTAAEKSSKPVSPPLRPVSPPVSRGASFVRKGTKSASPPPSSDAMGVSDSSFPVYEPQRSLGSVGNDQITTPRVAEEEDEEVYAEEDFESSASAKILGEPASEGAAIVKENQRVASPPIRAGAALEEEEDGDVDYAYEEEQYDEEFEGSADSMGSAGKKAGDGNLTSASIAQSSGKTAVLNVLYGDDEDNDGGGGGAMNEEEDDDMEYEPYGDENDDYEFD
jgi:hypothetical protein